MSEAQFDQPKSNQTLPHSIEAEQAVLGGLMLKNDAQFRETGVLLKPNFFSTEEARAMKAAVEELRSAGHMTDIHFNDEHENLQMPWMSVHQRLFQLLPWEARNTW